MELASHEFLRPQTHLAYIPEEEVRRGLETQDIVIDERIRDDINDFNLAFREAAPGARLPDGSLRPIVDWPIGPESWGEITHIGLSPSGDIRMIDVNEGGRIVERDQAAPRRFEVYVIKTDHSRYRLALSRVLLLLPNLRPGAGMVRLTPPLEAPWPFFDYDVVAAPLYFHPSERTAGRPIQDVILPTIADSASGRVSAVALDSSGDVLLYCSYERQIVRIPEGHAAHDRVLRELQRTIPGLRRGRGFTDVLFTAPPPWPFQPLEQAVDGNMVRMQRDGTWTRHPFDPPPPHIPAPLGRN